MRRDAAFSLFYQGINLGAFLGPIITGFLAQHERFRALITGWGMDPNSAWHWGFGAAGVGMTFGLIQYVLGWRHLGTAGLRPPTAELTRGVRAREAAGDDLHRRSASRVIVALGVRIATGAVTVTRERVTTVFTILLLTVTIGIFGSLFMRKDWTPVERKRLYMIARVLRRRGALLGRVRTGGIDAEPVRRSSSTNNVAFGSEFPSTLVAVAERRADRPPRAGLRVALGQAGQRASRPRATKFALGLIGVGLGFLYLVPGAQMALGGAKVGVSWLFMVYLIHTLAELCLSPVGLSAMTKLAPAQDRQPGHGHLVPRRVGRQLPGRTGGVVLRDAADADAADRGRDPADGARRRHAGLPEAS